MFFWNDGRRLGFGLPASAVGTAGLGLHVRHRQQELVWPNDPSGLRGWAQVPLVQTAWVQIPQVSYGSTPALPPPQKTKCGCSRHPLAHRNPVTHSPDRLIRHREDSSPCGQSPLDFESNSLAARTQCLLLAKTCVFQNQKEGATPSTCSWCHTRAGR